MLNRQVTTVYLARRSSNYHWNILRKNECLIYIISIVLTNNCFVLSYIFCLNIIYEVYLLPSVVIVSITVHHYLSAPVTCIDRDLSPVGWMVITCDVYSLPSYLIVRITAHHYLSVPFTICVCKDLSPMGWILIDSGISNHNKI